MAMYTNEELNEVRSKSDIVDLIGGYIPLTKKGKNYFGVCPFHDDHNPSMSVSPEKQIYRCFVCGASGNVFSFVQDYENISFPEAVELLANKNGISLNKKADTNYKKKTNKFVDTYSLANKFYINNLFTENGKDAISYLKKRGITKELIEEFQIGLSPNNSKKLTEFLKNKNINSEDLVKIGLAGFGDNGNFDIFKNRIMFPLFDIDGNIVGYSGRIYNSSDDPKYINTKETEIFKKGELLYNYHKAKNEVRRKRELILVEGFMDAIRLYSIGLKNVIALMGTALTKEQINLLKKLSLNVIVCMDGDSAGQKAAANIGDDLRKNNFDPKFVILEDNLDPDEFIIKNGPEKMISRLSNPLSYIEFKTKFFKNDLDIKNPEAVSKYVNKIVETLNEINDDVIAEVTAKNISRDIGISEDLILNKINKKETKANVKTLPKEKTLKKDYEVAERELIFYMLKSDEVSSIYENRISYLPTLEIRILANEIVDYRSRNDNLLIADFITHIKTNTNLINIVTEIESLDIPEEVDLNQIEEFVKILNNYNKKQEIKRLKQLIEKESDDIEKSKIGLRITKLEEDEE